jgi:hypothetical protein
VERTARRRPRGAAIGIAFFAAFDDAVSADGTRSWRKYQQKQEGRDEA